MRRTAMITLIALTAFACVAGVASAKKKKKSYPTTVVVTVVPGTSAPHASGTVSSAKAACIAGRSVTLTDFTTGAVFSATTDAGGAFSMTLTSVGVHHGDNANVTVASANHKLHGRKIVCLAGGRSGTV